MSEQLFPTMERPRSRGMVGIAVRLFIVGITFLIVNQLAAQTPTVPAPDEAAVPTAVEENTAPSAEATEAAPGNTMRVQPSELMIGWKQIRQMFQGLAGIPMWALVVCSIVLLMFVVDRLVVLQKSRVAPTPFTSRMIQHMRDGDLPRETVRELVEVCREHGSPISAFYAIVLENYGRSAFEIRTAVSDEADTEIYKLKRNIRAIGGLANLAPLLGLFGTVIGMIDAFRSLSQQVGGQGKSELLAQGISLALVATASGLGVAIVASVFYYYLQGKFEQCVQELSLLTNQAVSLVSSDGRLQVPPRAPAVTRK